MNLICAPHELTDTDSRVPAVSILAGLAVCIDCLGEVATLIESGYTPESIVARFAADAPDPDDSPADGFREW